MTSLGESLISFVRHLGGNRLSPSRNDPYFRINGLLFIFFLMVTNLSSITRWLRKRTRMSTPPRYPPPPELRMMRCLVTLSTLGCANFFSCFLYLDNNLFVCLVNATFPSKIYLAAKENHSIKSRDILLMNVVTHPYLFRLPEC